MKSKRTITFIVTKSCQLKCKYCYLIGKNNKEKMSVEVAKLAVDYVLDNPRLFPEDFVVLDFIGGEPLLEIGLIHVIVDYAVRQMHIKQHKWINAYQIRITTNGLLYSSFDVQQFIHKYRKHINISISIDGTKEKNDINRIFPNGYGSYDRIIDNVKLWKKQFKDIGTKMVISHEDVAYVFESAKHLLDLGINKLDMNTVVEDVWSEGDDLIFEKQLISLADYVVDNRLYYDKELYIFEEGIGHPVNKASSSPCGSMLLAIDASGNFYTCLRFAKFSLREKQMRTIGNVYDGIDLNKLRPYIAIGHDSISNQKCMNCDVASGCKWCPAENYDASETGTLFQRAIAVCKMHKARVRVKNYYWNRIYNIEENRQWKI